MHAEGREAAKGVGSVAHHRGTGALDAIFAD